MPVRIRPHHPKAIMPTLMLELLLDAGEAMAQQTAKAFQVEARRRSPKGGATLRPGRETPLWNELRRQLRPYLCRYGEQANLGRMLGLPRQQINAFVTSGRRMPDAERTLQLLAWLVAVQRGRRPS
ncbi:MAG TPA: hypothetical protein VF388_10875 [Lacunisphaera sp.]